jgi:hypothetical protein
MTAIIPFTDRRRLTIKLGWDLAYINWSYRVGPGNGRHMWLTSKDMILWHRWS